MIVDMLSVAVVVLTVAGVFVLAWSLMRRPPSTWFLLFWMPGILCLTGCTPPVYVVAGGIADGLKLAVGGYEVANHVERRSILAAAEPGCHAVPDAEVRACFDNALASFEAKRLPVKACIAAAAPVVRAAERAVESKDSKAAATVLPDLMVKAATCKAAIEEAQR